MGGQGKWSAEALGPKPSSASDQLILLLPVDLALLNRKQKLLEPYLSPRDCGEK